VFTAIVGIPLRWAIAIGLITGASNVIPYMGFAAAMLGGLAYAVLAEDNHPLIPLWPGRVFLAIPTITIAKVLAASSARHLTAYGLV
jgi:predicted PurR-regulated permease PerM